jgi:hypothetical protein
MVDVTIDPSREDEFNRWYDEEHVPEKLASPGFYSARRFKHHTDPHRYLALYEIEDGDLVTSPAYMTQPITEWNKSIMAAWERWDRNVWVEIAKPG